MNWTELRTVDDLSSLLEDQQLNSKPGFAIFKHSTRCATSFLVKKRLELSWSSNKDQVPIYLVDLIKNRDLSNVISTKFKVRHESPQLIYIQNGEALFNASHLSINSKVIQEFEKEKSDK